MLKEYPNLWPYTRDLYQTEGVMETIDKDHIRRIYQVCWTHVVCMIESTPTCLLLIIIVAYNDITSLVLCNITIVQ